LPAYDSVAENLANAKRQKILKGIPPVVLYFVFLVNILQRSFFSNNTNRKMSDKLDKIDLKILKILQDSSKITNLELSKRIGLSPAPTLERVKKLESAEVVESYHAKVNPQAIGLNVKTFVLVSLAWQKENALNHFLEKIREIEEITECYIITGEADFLIKIVCKDIPTYEQLLFKTLSQIDEIERLKTLMTLSTVKDSKVLPYKYE
jgi:DNA-binding Lrp family transcriptional regulator